MKAVIVDDEQHNIENLAGIFNRQFPEIIVTGTATSITEAAQLIESLHPDLIFLDIQMGKETGFDLLNKISKRNFEVIFVTAYDQYGIQAIKFAALDYIVKPIDANELTQAINKAKEKINLKQQNRQLDFLMNYIKAGRQPTKIALPQMQEVRYVAVADIIRCQAQNTYTFCFLNTGDKILVSKPLKEYDELLSPHGFIRSHQTHLVNPHYIKSYLKEDGGTLLLQDGTKVPVAKAKKEIVKQALSRG